MNVYELTKLQLLTYGQSWVEAFRKANGLPDVRQVVPGPPPARLVGGGPYASARLTGLYEQGIIWVNPAMCAIPAKGEGRSWSFPGYKTDRTTMGVLSHEFGHHVDMMLRLPSRKAEWKALRKDRPITSYEPVPSESFAETMRLFITNSDLLAAGSPARYRFLRETLGLQPVVSDHFPLVLRERGASPAIIAAACKWAAPFLQR